MRLARHRQIPERYHAHRLPPFHDGHAAHGMGAHEPHSVLDGVRRPDGDEAMTAQVRQGGGRRVLRLGHQPDDDIAVGDHATDLVVFQDNHVANLGVPHGAGGLVHRGGPGQRHGVGGHQLTNLLGHTLLLGLRPASRTLWCGAAVRVEPVRRRTPLTDMVPHAARHLPVWTLTAAPVLLEPTGW